MKKPLVLLIDSNALIHRAYHAYPSTLTTSQGQQINAVFGFFSIIIQVLIKYKPDQVFFAFDSKEKTFRHKMYPAYKATRKKTDQELIEQFKIVKDILTKINFNVIEKDGYEADDIIGTLSRMKEIQGKDKIIITGDGDLLQLINDEVKVFLSGSAFQKSVLYDAKTAEKKLGLAIDQIIEYKALRGDSSDNIPGIKGVGEISAKKMLTAYKNLEEIYNNLDSLDKAVKTKLEANREIAYLSRDLAKIDTNAPVTESLSNSKPDSVDYEQLRKVFWEFEFRSLISKLDNLENIFTHESAIKEVSQMDMFNVDKDGKQKMKFGQLADQDYLTMLNNSNYVVFYHDEIDQKICTKVDILVGAKHVLTLNCDEKEYLLLLDMIKNSKLKIIVFNSKLLHKIHISQKLPLLKIDFDIKLAAYLLRGGKTKTTLQELVYEFLNNPDTSQSSVELCKELYQTLEQELTKHDTGKSNLYKLLHELEIPLSQVLARMELAGIKLDKKYLESFEAKLSKLISLSETKIYDLAGEEFNIASPKQLGEILFSKLKLPGSKKGRNGSYSTNEKILNNLVKDFPIVQEVLNYRELAKLKSTYTSTLVNQIDAKTGRIHSIFHQDITATGRLSSTDPNLQNIPVSTELGQEVRRAFVSEQGKKFVFFDYSQQELRLLAHLSGDANLLEAFNSNIDIHALTASRLLKRSLTEVTKSERRMGKTVNFGIVYGISAFGLSDRLKIDTSLGQKYIDSFFTTYPGVKTYFDNLLHDARKNGYVTTILGRRKNTEGLKSPIFQVRKATEREIINFPLQGSAADMIKMAMVKAQRIIDDGYSDFATLVLQIHDELIFEVIDQKDDNKLKKFVREMNTMMLEIFELKVKMKVDTEVGYNLADSDKFIN